MMPIDTAEPVSNSQHRLLRESAERCLAELYPPDRRTDQGERADAWARFAELGWLAAAFGENNGGLGLDSASLGVLAECFGRHRVPEPYLTGIVLCGGLIERAADSRQRHALLAPLISGEVRCGLAMIAGNAALLPKTPGADPAWTLTGSTRLVVGGDTADAFIAAVMAGGNPSLVWVPRHSPGVTVTPYRLIDGRGAAAVSFSSVPIGRESPLGALGAGREPLAAAVDTAVLFACADAIGSLSRLLALTLEHVRIRRQFGRPLGDFQALQHRLVDMYIALEEARALVAAAQTTHPENTRQGRRLIAAARVKVIDGARRIARESVQLHGAMGMTDELEVGRHVKRLLVFELLFGSRERHLDVYRDRRSSVLDHE